MTQRNGRCLWVSAGRPRAVTAGSVAPIPRRNPRHGFPYGAAFGPFIVTVETRLSTSHLWEAMKPLLPAIPLTLFGLCIAMPSAMAAPSVPDHAGTVLQAACALPYTDAQKYRDAVPDGRIIAHEISRAGQGPGRAATEILLESGELLKIQLLFPGGRLRRAVVEGHTDQPNWSVRGDGACAVSEARVMEHDADGRPVRINVLENDLATLTYDIPMNPPVPIGTGTPGVLVGLVDSGVNYTLDAFAPFLARDADGNLIGQDFWDGDDRPFDIDNGRSPFFPFHHGSTVMSVLIAEAPVARVIPIRYPRPDMAKMAEAVSWLAAQDVKIVNLAMGSNRENDWTAFQAAAARHPEMLFLISAGNNGRNIDREPVFPAALDLGNAIVITSADPDGRLARGSNWGPRSVDIMVPGERLDVIDHRGAPGRASGSSYAVPRVTGLAVRMLEANPDWSGADLKRAILDRARPQGGRRMTRFGWIPDPSDGP